MNVDMKCVEHTRWRNKVAKNLNYFIRSHNYRRQYLSLFYKEIEWCALLCFGWGSFPYLVVIHVLHMPSNHVERSALYHNLFQWPQLQALLKKTQGHFEFNFWLEAFFALGNTPEHLVHTNAGYRSQFFLPMQFSWKGKPCLQDYNVIRSLNDSLVILKNTWNIVCCWQMGNIVMITKVGSIL